VQNPVSTSGWTLSPYWNERPESLFDQKDILQTSVSVAELIAWLGSRQYCQQNAGNSLIQVVPWAILAA
jgi:hypothetical protein